MSLSKEERHSEPSACCSWLTLIADTEQGGKSVIKNRGSDCYPTLTGQTDVKAFIASAGGDLQDMRHAVPCTEAMCLEGAGDGEHSR